MQLSISSNRPQIPKEQNKESSFLYFICDLNIKSAQKLLVKLTPGVNIARVFRTNVFFGSFSLVMFSLVPKFCERLTLMKLTPKLLFDSMNWKIRIQSRSSLQSENVFCCYIEKMRAVGDWG